MTSPDNSEALHQPRKPSLHSGEKEQLGDSSDYLLDDEPEDSVVPFIVSIGVILFISCGNFMVAPATQVIEPDSAFAWVLFGWIGGIGAQMAIHSVLVCLWNVSWLYRFGWGMLSGFLPTLGLLFGILAVSITKEWSIHHLRGTLSYFVCVPLFLLAVQVPFWGLRFCFKCRLVRASRTDAANELEVWKIRDLLKATAAVAIVLSLVRMAKPSSDNGNTFIWSVLGTALFSFLTSLFNAAPTALGILRGGRYLAIFIVIALLNLVTYIAILIGGTLLSGSPPPREAYLYIGYLVLGFWASLIAGLSVLRLLGFEILFGREQPGIRRGSS